MHSPQASTPKLEPRSRQVAAGDELMQGARGIAQSLLDQRLRDGDGSSTWRRPDRADPRQLVAAGPHLYDGLPGIAIFFAALGCLEGRDDYRELSLEIIAPLRRILRRLVAEPERVRSMRLEIGGLTGIGSFVYSLLTLGRLLDESQLLQEARQTVRLITPEHIAADRKLDVVSGAPGTILALVSLDRHAPDSVPRNSAALAVGVRCAEHLLSRRIERSDGTVAWSTNPAHPPLTGFAHGSTGICCALLAVYAATGREDLLAAALGAMSFERSTFSSRHGDWIDQTSPRLRFLNQWCFGAPGIALGRLINLDVIDDPAAREELEVALRVTADPAAGRRHHVCCGDMGRAEVLLYAFEKLGDQNHYLAACRIAREVLHSASPELRFRGMVTSVHRDPSFFSGEAGIGYTLLRLARPGRLPSILALS